MAKIWIEGMEFELGELLPVSYGGMRARLVKDEFGKELVVVEDHGRWRFWTP